MKNDLAHFNPNLSKGKKSRGCRAEAPKERVHSKISGSDNSISKGEGSDKNYKSKI